LLPTCSAVCRQTGMPSGALGPKYTSTGPRSHLGRHIPALGPLLHDSRNPFSNFALISVLTALTPCDPMRPRANPMRPHASGVPAGTPADPAPVGLPVAPAPSRTPDTVRTPYRLRAHDSRLRLWTLDSGFRPTPQPQPQSWCQCQCQCQCPGASITASASASGGSSSVAVSCCLL
jgi:hypothetical protein